MNFQSESSVVGKDFEKLVEGDLFNKNYKIISTNTKISDIGINVDYIAESSGIKEYGEAKGGKFGGKKRPGEL